MKSLICYVPVARCWDQTHLQHYPPPHLAALHMEPLTGKHLKDLIAAVQEIHENSTDDARIAVAVVAVTVVYWYKLELQ